MDRLRRTSLMTLSERFLMDFPVKEGAVSSIGFPSTSNPARENPFIFLLKAWLFWFHFHSRYDSVFRKSQSQGTYAQSSGSLQNNWSKPQLKSSWAWSLSFISHVERKLWKYFEILSCLFTFYMFLLHVDGPLTTLISVYLIGQQYSSVRYLICVDSLFLSMLTPALIWLYQWTIWYC